MTTSRTVTYDAEGLTMVGHLARPAGTGPWPAVLIGHDGVGLNDFQRGYADELARRGYLAMVLEYHGGRWYSDPDQLLARVVPLLADRDRLRTLGRAALEVLLAEPGVDGHRLAALGFGAGGNIVLELARDGVPLQAVAAVHPGLPPGDPMDWSAVTGPILLGTGSADPLCRPDQLLALTSALDGAGVDWRVTIYGGAKHAFWHPPVRSNGTLLDAAEPQPDRPEHAEYHRQHAHRWWNDVLALLAERLPVSSH